MKIIRRSLDRLRFIVIVLLMLLSLLWNFADSAGLLEGVGDYSSEENSETSGGNATNAVNPPILNLATRAEIFANATCGEKGAEHYCKLTEHVFLPRGRSSQCSVCDNAMGKRHPIKNAIDGTNRWWQSPSLAVGPEYEYVTITVDLKQVYQVAYVIIKAAISPRPGNWILERSLDGIVYMPWQYYAINDDECWFRYRIKAKAGKPQYDDDEEVICTSYFSSLYPLEGGEIHTSLVTGRPGASGPSERLTKFTMARFVRLRLQKIRTLHGDLINIVGPDRSIDKSVMRRYFYSIKDISIGGHCVCFGHANECIFDQNTKIWRCNCKDNTYGNDCSLCSPLWNQHEWKPGSICEPCQCFGHADACVYDPVVASQKLSLNTQGLYDGGGVCINCQGHTTGINCEKCEDGWYRPKGITRTTPNPCKKCQCNEQGSDGTCVADEAAADLLGKEPGDCICKVGYAGQLCDRCAVGYKGFPTCSPCPCHLPGITDLECKECVCKENVQGNTCSECKPGFFNLALDNPEGCTACFCHGVSNKCVSSNFAIERVLDPDNWLVSDLHGTKVTVANSNGGVYQVANEEFSAFSMYYWTNVKAFSGNKFLSYGLQMIFHISWVRARGDTSGKPIRDYDLIVQSTNNMLAFSNMAHEGNNATIHISLNELACVVLPDIDNNIIQRVPTAASGVPCTRLDVMEGLYDVKRLLIRAKYHTDQIEGMLSYALMEEADPEKTAESGERAATSIEVCTCPLGWEGTSCNECSYGYRKVTKDGWLNVCEKCDCHGHSSTCDENGKCLSCDHNTTGEKCDLCKEGYYGNATSETQFACKPCECPLSVSTNSFSPTCQISGNSYECTACHPAYEGPFCERCANGYWGTPTQPGDYCKPCNCNLNGNATLVQGPICDQLTGECLVCERLNALGWSCDECLPGHYRDPVTHICIACDCDEIGSINTATCNPQNGQCACKETFIGRRCSQCVQGHGNPIEGCPECDCNEIGSLVSDCDPVSGQCPCKSGVSGRFCNKCVDLHYGFSAKGCLACNCHQNGSDSPLCDLNSGQCHCLPNVMGEKCDTCTAGYWNIMSGCIPCSCNSIGSLSQICDPESGQCRCKINVVGQKCDTCAQGCYGFAEEGCRPCEQCSTPGHVCDSDYGRCICPRGTEGEFCQKCQVGFWGSPPYGCKPCNCSLHGSITSYCSPETGKCQCAAGFMGPKCDKCAFGYFNYPHCTPCACDHHGTDDKFCRNDGVCSCAENGQCYCKENVIGTKCDRCREGSFGLEMNHAEGCTECFCFHRTKKCAQGYFKWSRLALPYGRHIVSSPSARNENQLRVVNNLIVIPDHSSDVIIEKDISFSAPLYWQLPHIFLGDKILSYNGFLRFRTLSIGGPTVFPPRLLASYPLVQIQRYPSLILEHYPTAFDPHGIHEIRLHEDDWRLKQGHFNGPVTKEILMVALQNIQHILVRATHGPEVNNASLFNVSMDVAISSTNGDKTNTAHGIEVCLCPSEYNSTSCQNPKSGYYRWYRRDPLASTIIIDLVGEAKPCECSGRSTICDTETGFCLNCTTGYGGRKCEQCAIGYYGQPSHNQCFPCPCPSVYNNHAESCYLPPSSSSFQCFCKPGYTGPVCDRCVTGYYGRPWELGGKCVPCNCNKYGSLIDECDDLTGQCNCKPGVRSRDCSRCADRHLIVGKTCTSCDDQCTGTLLNELRAMDNDLKDIKIDKEAVSAIKSLAHMDNMTSILQSQIENRIITSTFLDDIPTHEMLSNIMLVRSGELEEQCSISLIDAHSIKRRGQGLWNRLELLKHQIHKHIKNLEDFIKGKAPAKDTSKAVDEMTMVVRMLNETSNVIEEITDMAEDELDIVFETMETAMEKIANASMTFQLQSRTRDLWEKLDDLNQYISDADKNSDEAARVVILAREFLDTARVNADAIDNLVIDMDLASVMTSSSLSDASFAITETSEVFAMTEDLLRDFRNTTKELEITETTLFEAIPLYRVTYAQPAFDHVTELEQHARYMERLLVSLNGSESVSAATAYQRIKEGFDKAFDLATEAKRNALDGARKINEILSESSTEVLVKYSADMIQEGLVLSGIAENAMRNNVTTCKSVLDSLKWRMKIANDSMNNMNTELEELSDSLYLDELLERINEIMETVDEVGMSVMDLEDKIQRELQSKIFGFTGGTSFDSVDANALVSNTGNRLKEVKSETARAERKEKEAEDKMDTTDDKLKNLKALIMQARHKANSIGVSIGPDETGTCFRLFKWPVVDSATSIKFNFSPTKFSDSLLFYWPSSITGDFIAIEMVSGQIKASWDLGSGLRTLFHPRKLVEVSEDSSDPDFWVQIQFQRVGASVNLSVTPMSMSDNTITIVPLSSPSPIPYYSTEEEMTLLTMDSNDLIHIGGMSKLMREGLVTNGLSGCIHNLQVNQQSVGLWNFVGNEGCAPCVECPNFDPQPSSGDLEFFFDGRGYSVIERLQSKTFNARLFDASLRFRTFAENGLIFLTMNEKIGQMISLELLEGRVIMQVRHKWEDQTNSLRIESAENEFYNTGEWVNVRAVWVYQKGVQIAKLMIGNRDFSQEMRSPSLSLNLFNSPYHIGGVSPIFNPLKWKDIIHIVPYVGCMKNILINNDPYNPLSGSYYGVSTPCGGKALYLVNFEGYGFAEYPSQSMEKTFKLGFSFKTLSPTGLLVLSASATSNTTEESYYAVYLENGLLNIKIGTPQGTIELAANETRYDDGKFHAVRLVKKTRKMILYMDDEEIMEERLPKSVFVIAAPMNRGLFLGGTSEEMQNKFQQVEIPTGRGFKGCLQNFYFNDELLSFSFAVRSLNALLGQCEKHHELDEASIPTQFLYPNTIGTIGISKFDIVRRVVEESCSAHEHLIEQENTFYALKFGDSPNSFATLNLDGNKQLKQRFNLTMSFRTYYPEGLLFQGLRKKGNGQCLMTYLKDGQIVVKLIGERSQDIVSPISNLNDGEWHQFSLVKAEDKMYLYVDDRDVSQIQAPKIKAVNKLNLGDLSTAANGHYCMENSDRPPVPLRGCVKDLIVNSHLISFESTHTVLGDVGSCFKNVERGAFFRGGSYAIYTHDLQLGSTMEIEMQFRSDSKNGLLISFVPNKSNRFPTFSIFLEDGKIIARESSSTEDYYEAVDGLDEGQSICDGQWHTIKATYEEGSITLRIDDHEAIYAVATQFTKNSSDGNTVVGSLYIGGLEDSVNVSSKKLQFHGCIRNISINQQRKDWTDMTLLNHVYINACPA